jgi:hypothetical protein
MHSPRCAYGTLLFLAAAATARGTTYPGASPCSATLQACVDGTAPGGTIAIATNTPIDEDLTVAKTLTLTASPGFTPTIGTGALRRTLTVADAGAGGGIVQITISGLHLNNAGVQVTLANDAGHRVAIRDCMVAQQMGPTTSTGIGATVSVPATVSLEHNVVAASGSAIHVVAAPATGSATVSVVANRVTTYNAASSLNGLLVEIQGTGTATVYVYSNVIYSLAGASGGAGIDVRSPTAGGAAAVNIVNNTLDDIRVSNGIQIRSPNASAQVAVNLFNNVVTRAAKSGIAVLQSPAVPQLTVTAGFDDSGIALNALPDAFGGYNPGPGTLSVDPQYVDRAVGDYHLQAGSPLIDAGTANPVGGLPAVDADEHFRTAGAAPDLGAYEFGSMPVGTTTTTTVTATTTTTQPVCATGPSYPLLECRLEALHARVREEVPAGSLSLGLLATSTRARTATVTADALAAQGKQRAARSSLGKAIRALGRFGARLRSPKGKRLPANVLQDLLGLAGGLRADLRALRGPSS